MLVLSPKITEPMQELYEAGSQDYGSFPPHQEIAHLTEDNIRGLVFGDEEVRKRLNKDCVLEFDDSEYLKASSRLVEICYLFGSNEIDPQIYAEQLRLFMAGILPDTPGISGRPSTFVEEHLLDFSSIMLGYLVQTTDTQIRVENISSESRKRFVKSKVIIYDSIALELQKILVDNKRPGDVRKFVSEIFFALRSLHIYDAITYEYNLASDEFPLSMGIPSSITTHRQLADIFNRIGNIIATVNPVQKGIETLASEEEVTQPVEL